LLDRSWSQALAALHRATVDGANVLLPDGDWPELRYTTTRYCNTDTNISISGQDAILLHKGMLTSFRQADIRECLGNLTVAYANDVFVLFCRWPRGRSLFFRSHLNALKTYADPARFHRKGGRRCAFVHIPKTGGTSIWSRISSGIRANVYFSSNQALAAFDGDINQFDAVGGHFHIEVLLAKGWQGSVFFVLRDPVARILSSIAHARRLDENLGQFDANQLAMRNLDDHTPHQTLRSILLHEGNMQVRALAERPDDMLAGTTALGLLGRRAIERLDSPRCSFGLLAEPRRLGQQVSAAFGLRNDRLPHLNQTAQTTSPSYVATVRRFLASEPSLCMDLVLYEQAIARRFVSEP